MEEKILFEFNLSFYDSGFHFSTKETRWNG